MEAFKWTAGMALGIPKVDLAHRAFLDRLARMLTMPDDQFGPAFLAMIAELEADFNEEERLMERIDFAGMRDHLEQHARVLGALHHVAPRVMEGDFALGRQAVELLPQWFLEHLSTMDAALAVALRGGRQEADTMVASDGWREDGTFPAHTN